MASPLCDFPRRYEKERGYNNMKAARLSVIEISQQFRVSRHTVYEWGRRHPDFPKRDKKGRLHYGDVLNWRIAQMRKAKEKAEAEMFPDVSSLYSPVDHFTTTHG
jgi:hypothetical protein